MNDALPSKISLNMASSVASGVVCLLSDERERCVPLLRFDLPTPHSGKKMVEIIVAGCFWFLF